jgi:predicted acylesterase/phospholipase RssA
MYRILSLDGGGIRGLLTATLIQRLAVECPGWMGRIDITAGTSTGGILALGIGAGLTPDALVALYRDNGATIFRESWADRLTSLDEMVSPDFDAKHLDTTLHAVFGDRTLADLSRRVLVTTYDLQMDRFKVLDSACERDKPMRIADAARRTSAAPTYFATHQGCIDGGVVANNPTMCAVAQAIHDGVAVGYIRALSLGTGQPPPKPYPFKYARDGSPEPLSWGLIQWAPRLIPLLFDAGLGAVDYYAGQVLGPRQHRFNPQLSHAIDLADAAAIPALLNAGQIADLDHTIAWVEHYWLGND